MGNNYFAGTQFDRLVWSNTLTSASSAQRTLKGFAFKANFPFVLNSVKLAKWGQTPGQTVVTLTNAHTHEQLDSLQFSAFSQNEAELKTQPYLLPRGFEGILRIDGDFQASSSNCHHWSDHGNFFKVTWLIDNGTTLPVDTKDVCVPFAISFRYSGAYFRYDLFWGEDRTTASLVCTFECLLFFFIIYFLQIFLSRKCFT